MGDRVSLANVTAAWLASEVLAMAGDNVQMRGEGEESGKGSEDPKVTSLVTQVAQVSLIAPGSGSDSGKKSTSGLSRALAVRRVDPPFKKGNRRQVKFGPNHLHYTGVELIRRLLQEDKSHVPGSEAI